MTFLKDWEGVFETKNLLWCGQSGPKLDFPTSDQAFWSPFGPHFGRLWRLKRHQKMKSVSDAFLGSNFNQNLMDFDPKYESREDDTLPEVLKCAKSIFEQPSICFEGFSAPSSNGIIGFANKNPCKILTKFRSLFPTDFLLKWRAKNLPISNQNSVQK